MRVHSLQHVPFEGLGSIGPWLAARSAELTVTRLWEEARFPDLRDVDWLIVMGGPMSVNDEHALPWLVPERRFIARAIQSDKPVLGVCLGAQLIASALGAEVFANAEPEIGWLPVEAAPGAAASPFAPLLPSPLEAFHWHGETFALPAGATHLAQSAACRHQAFSLGERVLALQFHLETTPQSARALIEHCGDELVPAPYVQSASEMLRETERFCRIQRVMDGVLAHLAERASTT